MSRPLLVFPWFPPARILIGTILLYLLVWYIVQQVRLRYGKHNAAKLGGDSIFSESGASDLGAGIITTYLIIVLGSLVLLAIALGIAGG